MKPTIEEFQAACPEVDPQFIAEHISRLSDRYFNTFSNHQLYAHLSGLAQITPASPVKTILEYKADGEFECTVLSFDYLGVFSLITGLLAGTGASIHFGEIFSYAPGVSRQAGPKRYLDPRRYPRSRQEQLLKRRRIVDHFTGTITDAGSFEDWKGEFNKILEELLLLREQGDERSIQTVRHRVNEMVVQRLTSLDIEYTPNLYPVSIEIDNSQETTTRLKIISTDTPAFLYSLSHAFSLHGINIEHVRIHTKEGQIEDEIDIVDARGKKIDDPDMMNRIKLSVLLTKQFTYFLGKAPDPYAALRRFKQFVENILNQPGKENWIKALSNPHTLKDLALLLGTSDYLWEDFIRIQYETLLPMFQPMVAGRRFSQSKQTMADRLDKALEGATSLEEKRKRLNAFKDQELFQIDLDHILNPQSDFRNLAARLTHLAEKVVNKAVEIAFHHQAERFGIPKTAAGFEANHAILGLGKLGGAALGYASDIELLFVYSDTGMTNGQKSIPNSEFFNLLVRTTTQLIESKREGIFQVDMRLRPYGNSGSLACSLESFCNYYGRGGPSHSYERLALVRLRTIGGNKDLGARIERIRDQIVYASQDINLEELRELRQKQYQEKTKRGRKNAKFSLGALVDLEYNVQILQVLHGKEIRELRTPKIHEALIKLADAGVMSPQETHSLIAAYDFFRCLINAMRMLRGSAKDLFLPAEDSLEFNHLARRMGYKRGEAMSSAQQLSLDYEMHTAAVRVFAKRYFGRKTLPGPVTGTVADLVLAERVPKVLYRHIFTDAGFQNPDRAYTNLLGLAGSGSRRSRFAKLAIMGFDILRQTAAPDMALNNWENFTHGLANTTSHFNLLMSQPIRLEILLNIFAGSQFLADTLIHYPHLFDWVINPKTLQRPQKKTDLEKDLYNGFNDPLDLPRWLNHLRHFRRRHILRIGTRDMALKRPTEEIMLGLSTLADAMVTAALQGVFTRMKHENKFPQACADNPESLFCLLAFGKLGGYELNYSSDIDLLGFYSAPTDNANETAEVDAASLKGLYALATEQLSLDLSRHTEAGYAYRVDLRLRPYGKAGELVPSLSRLVEYYRSEASLWEIQAAMKLRPVAGNIHLGYYFLEQIRPVLLQRRQRSEIVESVEGMRQAAIKKYSRFSSSTTDVKSGAGGIRDVEFLIQGLQLIHAPDHPILLRSNTLKALENLGDLNILPATVTAQLKTDYLFMRQVEHCLQILEDRQIHTLPKDPREMNTLARKVMGVEGSSDEFQEALQDCQNRIRQTYTTYLLEG